MENLSVTNEQNFTKVSSSGVGGVRLSGNCEIPDRLGFSRHMKTRLGVGGVRASFLRIPFSQASYTFLPPLHVLLPSPIKKGDSKHTLVIKLATSLSLFPMFALLLLRTRVFYRIS